MILEVYLLARVRYWTLLVFCSVTLYWLVENWTVPCGLSFGCMDKTKFLLGPILPLLADTKVNTISCWKKKKEVFIDVTMYNSSVYCRYLFFFTLLPAIMQLSHFFLCENTNWTSRLIPSNIHRLIPTIIFNLNKLSAIWHPTGFKFLHQH